MSIEQLRSYPHGRDFGCEGVDVQPSDNDSRFDVMPEDVRQEMGAFIRSWRSSIDFVRDGKAFSHLLCVRRLRDFFNSNGIHVPSVRKRNPVNEARFNPDDVAELHIAPGDLIELESSRLGKGVRGRRSRPSHRRRHLAARLGLTSRQR